MQKYAFFQCDDCQTGFAIEELEDDPIEEPVCPVPGCGCEMARFVGTVELPMPLPVTRTIVKSDEEGVQRADM